MNEVKLFSVTVCWLDGRGNHSRNVRAVGLSQQEACNHAIAAVKTYNEKGVGFTVTDAREVPDNAGYTASDDVSRSGFYAHR